MNAEYLVAELCDLLAAASAEQIKKDAYEGMSWDYAGSYLIETRRQAAERFTNALNDYIDARITRLTGAC